MKLHSRPEGGYSIFCYTCKRYFLYSHKKKSDAVKAFHDEGHRSKKYAFLKPDLGRTSRRHSGAVRVKRLEQERS